MTDTLPPGRELDADVARVMGWAEAPAILANMHGGMPSFMRDGIVYFQKLPHLSTTYESMGLCLEWLRQDECDDISLHWTEDKEWCVYLWKRGMKAVMEYAPTLPHAVALAVIEYGRATKQTAVPSQPQPQ